jgi:prevent-host-death family protein
MTITTLSSRQFNQDAGKAKKAASAGPVIITDRGRPSHVLLTFDDYQKIAGSRGNIADLLAMPAIDDVDLAIPRSAETARAAELS